MCFPFRAEDFSANSFSKAATSTQNICKVHHRFACLVPSRLNQQATGALPAGIELLE